MGRVSEVRMIADKFKGANRESLISLSYGESDRFPYLDADQQVLLGQIVGEAEFPEKWQESQRYKTTYAHPELMEALKWIHSDSEIGKFLRDACKKGAWFYARERITKNSIVDPIAIERDDGNIDMDVGEYQNSNPIKIDENSVSKTLYTPGLYYDLTRNIAAEGKEPEYIDIPIRDVGFRFSPEGQSAIWVTWLEKQDMCMIGGGWPSNKDKDGLILLKASRPPRRMTEEEIARETRLRDTIANMQPEREALPMEPSPEPKSLVQMKLF